MSRFFTFILITSSLSLSALQAEEEIRIPPAKTLRATLERVAPLAQGKNWTEIVELVHDNEVNPLYRLLRNYALFQLKDWESLRQTSPIRHSLYADYDLYLRALAARESNDLEALSKVEVGDGLPLHLRRDLELTRARSLIELEKPQEARDLLQQFIRRHRSGPQNSEAQLELAAIEAKLGNTDRAVQLYESLYVQHPVRDRQNIAGQRLREFGHFTSIGVEQHLERVNQLRRAALFERALKELKEIKSVIGENEQHQIKLLEAVIEFSRRSYTNSEKQARDKLKKIDKNHPLYSDWLGLWAFSLTRLGRFAEATKLYDQLLAREIADSERQQILLRLGLMDVDDKNFVRAAERFQRLREDFPRGRFVESSHWFEAWSRLQNQKLRKKKKQELNPEELDASFRLLERLPTLSEGFFMTPQSIYWRIRIQELRGETDTQSLKSELLTDWRASFYATYVNDSGLDFLRFRSNALEIDRVEASRRSFQVADAVFRRDSWRRVEAFASLHLYDWAQLEMQRFLSEIRINNDGLRRAIAFRLQELKDWSDLVRFSTTQFRSVLKNLSVGDDIAYFQYPQAYFDEILTGARENQISPFLIWGVMREESRFQADAISGAGAVGLMQLMPALAERIARDKREARPSREDLKDPQLNIRYGSFHLAELVKQVEGLGMGAQWTFPLVVASYNAGINPVRRWLRENSTESLDEWIENIPFSETRNYVKRVIQSAHVYYQLYGEPIASMATTRKDKEL